MTNYDELTNHEDCILDISGSKIKIKKDVFAPNPKLTNSTYIILNNLPDVKNKDVLDMGTGSGALAVHCAKKEARVTAVDISEKAVENTKENFSENNLRGEIFQSNLFENVKGTFDYILANLPICYDHYEDKAIGIIEEFLKNAKEYLNPGAKIYLTWFSIKSDEDILELINKYDYKKEIITEEKLGYTWQIFIIQK